MWCLLSRTNEFCRSRKIWCKCKLHLKINYICSICSARFAPLMKSSMFRSAVLLFLIPAGAFSATNVVNLSHYDMMRPDFVTMKSQGIVGVIHEATYPPFVRDAKYL